uniref:6-phosphogluconolactonase n=1 Tax=Phenylobacterium glaciei TaxID=2803784 RepID=A0A974P4A9_9CAUL|nr:6-phosphogluconolactonase [Phenylobacterium glaciei]
MSSASERSFSIRPARGALWAGDDRNLRRRGRPGRRRRRRDRGGPGRRSGRPGHASLIGTGGRSPTPVYDLLSGADVNWGRVTVGLSDDRFVPITSPDSNERLVCERLLRAARRRPASCRSMPTSPVPRRPRTSPSPTSARWPLRYAVPWHGEDGHVASLIPGSPVMTAGLDPVGERYVIGVPAGVGSPPVARISLTLPALLQARITLLLIRGAVKRQIVAHGSGLPVHALLKQAKAPCASSGRREFPERDSLKWIPVQAPVTL